MKYIWERAKWPHFCWREAEVAPALAEVAQAQGRLLGRMEDIGFDARQRATLDTLSQDVVKSSEIEGERLDARQVRSSLARKLGVETGALTPADRQVDGVVEMTLDATRNFAAPLTRKRLFGWHGALFPTGYSGMQRIRVGRWRDDRAGPMEVFSGAIGRERVHYVAPPAERLEAEMRAFCAWFNRRGGAAAGTHPLLKAAVAHLWFVTLHPFEDGNGRIARAIADMALSRAEGSEQRFYSMSAQIRIERKGYYDILERTQKGKEDITAWTLWFLACLHQAVDNAEEGLASVLAKARFWRRHGGGGWNGRQVALVNRLLDGFVGHMTSSKWAKIANTSQDTASRDIADLVARGALRRRGGGRATHYEVVVKD